MPEHVTVALGACIRDDSRPDVPGTVAGAFGALGLRAPEPVLHRDDGSPVLASGSRHVSVSHDHACVAVAMHGSPVGVDLQHVAPTSARFSEHLRQRTSPRPGRWTDSDTIRSWTVREAVAKAGRLGLSGRPWTWTLRGTVCGRHETWAWTSVFLTDHRAWLAVAVHDPEQIIEPATLEVVLARPARAVTAA